MTDTMAVETGEVLELVAERTIAYALLTEMVASRDAGYHFSSDSDWSTCPSCGYVTFLEGDRGHMEDCPITRARELLGIEV